MDARILVARNLRRLWVAKGLSQEALAVDAGIDRTYVSRLERGMENPTVGVLERLTQALDLTPATSLAWRPATTGPPSEKIDTTELVTATVAARKLQRRGRGCRKGPVTPRARVVSSPAELWHRLVLLRRVSAWQLA
jgi:transcriptional regulator with XRE-family HTH domain